MRPSWVRFASLLHVLIPATASHTCLPRRLHVLTVSSSPQEALHLQSISSPENLQTYSSFFCSSQQLLIEFPGRDRPCASQQSTSDHTRYKTTLHKSSKHMGRVFNAKQFFFRGGRSFHEIFVLARCDVNVQLVENWPRPSFSTYFQTPSRDLTSDDRRGFCCQGSVSS